MISDRCHGDILTVVTKIRCQINKYLMCHSNAKGVLRLLRPVNCAPSSAPEPSAPRHLRPVNCAPSTAPEPFAPHVNCAPSSAPQVNNSACTGNLN